MQCLVLRHEQTHRRHFLHLASLAAHHRCRVEFRLAGGADRRAVLHHGVGGRHQVQRLAAVAQLPARLFAAAPAQALRPALQSVARGRLAAVVAVLGRAGLQLLHAGQQGRHLRSQRGVLGF